MSDTAAPADAAAPAGAVTGTVRFGSCDAEARWRPADLATLPALRNPHSERLTREMDQLQAVLCAPGDTLLTNRQPPSVFTELMRSAGFGARHLAVPGDPAEPVERRLAAHPVPGLAGMAAAPYAVLDGTAEALARQGLAGAAPPLEAVRLVNSKTWTTRLGHPGSGRVVTGLADLRAAVEETGPCVVKDPYGVSGQGNLVLESPERLAFLERHLTREVERRGARIELVVQQLHRPAEDFAAHLAVGPDGRVHWHGIRQVLNDGHAYRGSDRPSADLLARLERAGYRETAESVAAAAAAAGYRGPLAVDSMTTADGTLVPVLEVNARLSPGTIAQRLDARLELRIVPVDGDDWFDRLVDALDRARLLATAGRPGLLPLAAGTLAAPRGWLFLAVLGDADPAPLTPVLERLT
ncbi:hypothetical protein ABZ747_25275 [Kitasatospora cineracea]|uniref:hypothetical protein n=1 Tax=Kitasatospora cineracea TaxID=88074 RepID=UPI00340B938D